MPSSSKRIPRLTAATADKYDLYIQSVQCVEVEIDFIIDLFMRRRWRAMVSLREDFCGAFAAAAEFVRRSPEHTAYAIDLDPEVLAWGRKHILPQLAAARRRDLHLLRQNVLEVTAPVDAVIAMNFSYFIFKRREELRAYFKTVYKTLNRDGIFFLDAYGGIEAQKVTRDKKKCKGFTYVWDQAAYNPITNEALNHIHFYFPDRTKMLRAFTYDWRLWTLQEIKEILAEVGFTDIGVYWEEWDDATNTGTGEFNRTDKAENCEAWVAYVAAEK